MNLQMFRYAISLLIWPSLGKNICQAGENHQPGVKIIGGVDARPGEFPYLAGIFNRSISDENALVCGGTIIREDVVLTSGFCIELLSDNLTNYIVYAGLHDISNFSDPNIQRADIKEVILHATFDSNGNHSTSFTDIGLIFLSTQFFQTERVKSVSLPRRGYVPNLNFGTVVGWGATTMTSEMSPVLQKAEVSFVDNSTCSANHSKLIDFNPNFQLCAGDQNNDACLGDMGSPLLIGEEPNKIVYGLVSNYGVCNKYWNTTTGSIYTIIPPFERWIDLEMVSHPPHIGTPGITDFTGENTSGNYFSTEMSTESSATRTFVSIFIFMFLVLRSISIDSIINDFIV